MPTVVLEPPPIVDPPLRKRWTREEYDGLSSLELLSGQRLELIEGELIDKMGKKPPHVLWLSLLSDWVVSVFGTLFVLQEAPIDVAPEDNPTNEPEPDLIVLKRMKTFFLSVKPCPEDLHLVVEVADSSLGLDLRTKAALYARAGIVEYWVLDINGRRMIVHRDPQAGRYTSVVAYGEDESVAPLAAPEESLRIRDAFPV
jgi:Uma2 family endonuclease